ncbi:hypothetical protein Mgra_00006983 [Meloidogyne graminicola]|uniref:Candidate secreted effector n=1 Tax=Meloidogyne graminicola TaxID=189291 RepID=A0A8S9ZJX6_9BILA|nr:hypothetical protein Mgra_00006983 [Meloidogyne graminicola]
MHKLIVLFAVLFLMTQIFIISAQDETSTPAPKPPNDGDEDIEEEIEDDPASAKGGKGGKGYWCGNKWCKYYYCKCGWKKNGGYYCYSC